MGQTLDATNMLLKQSIDEGTFPLAETQHERVYKLQYKKIIIQLRN
jgi:hypothetical protein